MNSLRLGGMGIILAVVLSMTANVVARAEEYLIGPEDVLQVSVWMHPELERSVTVGTGGNITFPPLGDLKAAGQTRDQLAARLADRLSTYLRQTATVTVSVSQYLSQSVFVSGAVAKPGRYGFERLPGLLDVISQAGGATAGADLTQVQIIRRDGDLRRPQTVDLARTLAGGSEAGLPALRTGDTVVVPSGPPAGVIIPADAVGVLGEVNRPGLYPVGTGLDLWNTLAAAGGLTARGNLADVRVVVRQKDGSTSVLPVNLKEQLQRAARQPVVVHAGDVVVVTGTTGWGSAWTGFTQFLSISRDLVNIVVLADYLKKNVR